MKRAISFADDTRPGITRRLIRGKWAYYLPGGDRITDRDEIDRLNAIGLPPAYQNAWFATDANAHLLATGIDARGRKQYRYHDDFRAQRDAIKFDHCAEFGHALPRIRARVDLDLGDRGLTARRAVASVVRLLDSGQIRVGNEVYAKENKSFGATTLRRRHAEIKRRALRLRWRAKSGKDRDITVTDRSLIRFVRKVQDLPGQHLFQYLDEDGDPCPVTSCDVNDYVREVSGGDFTAKDFRTWRASALAFEWLAEPRAASGLKPMLDFVSEHLGNTPAIARKSYIHPALIEVARDRGMAFREELKLPRRTKWESRYERGLQAFLVRLAQ